MQRVRDGDSKIAALVPSCLNSCRVVKFQPYDRQWPRV